jgi:hypothetical protein
MKDTCILCGVETAYDETTHVDMRVGYIEGFGQLCSKCYREGTNPKFISVSEHTIINTPNNMELGEKVRRLYDESR